MKETEALLRLLILRHLMLELAALLGEGASAIVNPLIAVNLLSLAVGARNSVHRAGTVGAREHNGAAGGRSVGDNGVDARLIVSQTSACIQVLPM